MKTAIVYWSGTGNTEAMAKAVCEAAAAKGAEVKLYTASEFAADEAAAYDAFGFGCPAMGAEVLEEGEFEPMFSSVEGCLVGKKVYNAPWGPWRNRSELPAVGDGRFYGHGRLRPYVPR